MMQNKCRERRQTWKSIELLKIFLIKRLPESLSSVLFLAVFLPLPSGFPGSLPVLQRAWTPAKDLAAGSRSLAANVTRLWVGC